MHIHICLYVHLSNTTAKGRDIAKQALGPAQESHREKRADIITSDFNTSTCGERGKAKLSSIEEAWEETLLIPPPDVVPTW